MPQRVESSVVVEAPVSRVYEYWRDLENLSNFMSNVEDVRSTGPGMTHWVVKGPLQRHSQRLSLESVAAVREPAFCVFGRDSRERPA